MQTEALRIHLVLIDLAPATNAGHGQKERPVHIGADEFIEEYRRLVASEQ